MDNRTDRSAAPPYPPGLHVPSPNRAREGASVQKRGAIRHALPRPAGPGQSGKKVENFHLAGNRSPPGLFYLNWLNLPSIQHFSGNYTLDTVGEPIYHFGHQLSMGYLGMSSLKGIRGDSFAFTNNPGGKTRDSRKQGTAGFFAQQEDRRRIRK